MTCAVVSFPFPVFNIISGLDSQGLIGHRCSIIVTARLQRSFASCHARKRRVFKPARTRQPRVLNPHHYLDDGGVEHEAWILESMGSRAAMQAEGEVRCWVRSGEN